MYSYLILVHSILRWLVFISLSFAVFRACKGYITDRTFSKTDNFIRHTTATIAHIQLMTGILLYTQSPVVKHFWQHFHEAKDTFELVFFGLIHLILMLIAIILVTIGSSMAKRKTSGKEKFKTMMIWFSMGLFIISIAIPWPFSPLAVRPYFR